jgi:hypothetical protein
MRSCMLPAVRVPHDDPQSVRWRGGFASPSGPLPSQVDGARSPAGHYVQALADMFFAEIEAKYV